MAQIRIWSWSRRPGRPRLAGVLRDHLGVRLTAAVEQTDTLLVDGGCIDVDGLEARFLAPFMSSLADLGANAELEL